MAADDVKGFTRFKFEVGQKLDAIAWRIAVFLIAFVLTMVAFFSAFSDATKVNNGVVYSLAHAANSAGLREQGFKLKTSGGSIQVFQAGQYRYHRELLDGVDHLEKMLMVGGGISTVLASVATYLVMRVFRRYRSGKKQKKMHIRGAKLVEADALADLVEERGEVSPYRIGGIPVPTSKVNRHMYLSGDTGVGKTQQLMDILEVIRKRGEKTIILDKNGELMSHFYNPATDHILGPFDDRTHNWSCFSEGCREVDFDRLARSFIPSTDAPGKDDHWPESALRVFSGLLHRISQQSEIKATNEGVLVALLDKQKVVEKDLLGRDQIVEKTKAYELLKGTLAGVSIDPNSPDHASSVIGTLTPKIDALKHMRGLENRPEFSIREWIKNDNEKGWLFLRATEDEYDAVVPLLTAWLDTAIKAVLSLEKSPSRVIWWVADELQSLGKINSLKKALFEGRKHGLRCLVGFTSVNELFQIYGHESAKAMISMFNTKVVFQTDEPGAAEWNAKLLGMEEALQEHENLNYGDRESRGVNEHRDAHRYIVMPSEIQTLPNLTAYVKFAGDWPVAKVVTKAKDRPIVAPPTILRPEPPPLIIEEAEPQKAATPAKKAGASPAKPKPQQDEYLEDEPLC